MRCLLCRSGKMKEALSTYFSQTGNCYIIIENVPCVKCGQCGEILYSASVMEKIDDIISGLSKIASRIFIMNYSEAA